MYILGISCYYHDAAAALLRDGVLVAAAEEERFSRKKHDYGFPSEAISFCLAQAGISSRDLDYVVFYEKPLLKFERILLTNLQTFPQSWRVFRESMITWFNEKLWVKGKILTELDIPDEKLLFVEHHLSHATSAFFCSPYDEAAILTVDGVGEWTTTTIGEGTAFWAEGQRRSSVEQKENTIKLFNEVRFPHSLGLLYSAFTAFLGFKVNNGEYKVMGMAPYGGPNRVEGVYKLAVTHEGGSGRLQTVRRDWNLLYYRAVELFGEATGVPVLLNTSFNLRGEPIVTTPTNALNTFDKSDIDTLYMDGFIVRKTGNDR